MRQAFSISLLSFWLGACALPFRSSAPTSPCERVAPDEKTEPLFAFARQLLTDSASAAVRAEYGLPTAAVPTWVGDPSTCRRLAAALAEGSGKEPDFSQPLAAVRLGSFYIVRRGPGAEWLIGPDLRVRTVFVGT